jgi:hypothetical protein
LATSMHPAGCTYAFVTSLGGAGAPCTATGDCQPGHACNLGTCAKLCETTADCPLATQKCGTTGLCVDIADQSCTSAADCIRPGPCDNAAFARCEVGVCRYPHKPVGTSCDDQNSCTKDTTCSSAGACLGTLVVCNSPPVNHCDSNNSVFVTYEASGTCVPADGSCNYTEFSLPCTNCASTCLQACAGTTCPQDDGPCRTSGHCDPLTTPPSCAYINAPDGKICRPATGSCDPAEGCSGGACPPDSVPQSICDKFGCQCDQTTGNCCG